MCKTNTKKNNKYLYEIFNNIDPANILTKEIGASFLLHGKFFIAFK